MNDFFKLKIAFAIALLPTLIIISPILKPSLDKINILIFTNNFSALQIYYLMILTLLISILSYSFLFISEGKFNKVRVVGDIFYTFCLVLPILFILVWIIQNLIIRLPTLLSQWMLVVLTSLIIISLTFYLTVQNKKTLNSIFLKLESKSISDIVLVSNTKGSKFYEFIKRIFDLFFSIIYLIFLMPIMLLISALIKLETKGPLIYHQNRIGQLEKRFKLVKFRTKRTKIINNKGNKSASDITVYTKIGKILRRTSLDEIPMIYNILKGDLSLVGPLLLKPAHFTAVLDNEDTKNVYSSVKPGIAGLGILVLWKNPDIEQITKSDLYYIQNKSIKLDLMIIIETMRRVLFNNN